MKIKQILTLAIHAAFGLSMVAFAKAPNQENTPPTPQNISHILNRLSFGLKKGDVEKIRHSGIANYVNEQLYPESIPLPLELQNSVNTLLALQPSQTEQLRILHKIYLLNKAKKSGDETDSETLKALKKDRDQAKDAGIQLHLLQALQSPRQLQEILVDFWFNYFNVNQNKDEVQYFVNDYERQAIRPNVLGHFRDLLGATAKHPAMLHYLDNWQSVANNKPTSKTTKVRGLNENYARELMELHTLGVNGGYTQKDVTELARILTGWTFNRSQVINGEADLIFLFNNKQHDQGNKKWLGRTIVANGQAEGEQALDILASSPATAKHVSYRLAQYFVNDKPSDTLVQTMSNIYLKTQGDIRAVLRTLFNSKDFWDARNIGNKFKTPYQYTLSVARAVDLPNNQVRLLQGSLNQMGMPVYGCQTPDGYKNTREAWLNTDAMTSRISFADRINDLKQNQKPLVNVTTLENTLSTLLTQSTLEVVHKNDAKLQGALILGSPELMNR